MYKKACSNSGKGARRRGLSLFMAIAICILCLPVCPVSAASSGQAIAFVESNVADYQMLADGAARDTEVYILDPARDGLAQMAGILAGRSGIDAIHILSHGSAGRIDLGASELSVDNIDKHAAGLEKIGAALREGGDLLLYGCGTAKGTAGESFLRELAETTGADVAASDDPTGAAGMGGDWVLEAASGTVESDGIFEEAGFNAYPHLLADPVAVMPSGSGNSSGDPYIIDSLNKLYWIADQVNNNSNKFDEKYFKQTVDIVATETSSWFGGQGWEPIAYDIGGIFSRVFAGIYDGQNHTISNLYVNRTGIKCVGLFGNCENATVKNLGLVNASITADQTSSEYTGSLIGYASYDTIVGNCFATGNVKGYNKVGGFIGICGDDGYDASVSDCYANCEVSAARCAGGFIGECRASTVSNCYSLGNVTLHAGTTAGFNKYAGGFVGFYTSEMSMRYCYSTGAVSGGDYLGGLASSGSTNLASFTNCFWDKDTSGMASSYGGTGKTTAEMKTLSTYTGADWDFTGNSISAGEFYWVIDGSKNNGYPYRVMKASNVAPQATNVTISGLAVAGETLTGSCTVTDADGDTTSAAIKWYRAYDSAGTTKSAISAANSADYLVTASDLGKYLVFEVTPNASTGILTGTVVIAIIGPVTKQTQAVITYNGVTKTYGDAVFTHTATGGSGTGAFSYSSSNTSVAAINASTGAVTIIAAGTTTLAAIKAGDDSYEAASKSCVLTVNNALLTATIGDYSKTYGDVNPEFIVNVAGFENGETTASASGYVAPVVTCTAAAFTGAGPYPITISGGSAANYTFDTTDTGALTISKKTLTATASAIGKVYNRNTDAAGYIGLTGIVNSDAVTAGAIFTFEDAVAGTGKTVNVSNITLGGEKKDNYTLSNTTASAIADITPKTLGVTVSAISKPYDGTTNATGTVTLSGIIAPDVVTAGAIFSFENKTVGTDKTVNVTNIELGGANAGNYAVSSTTASAIADITKLAQAAIIYNNATTTYGAISFVHAATGGSGIGAFSYSSSNTSVAAINASTGAVTIIGAGTTTLTAIKAFDATYEAASKSCVLTVNNAHLTATIGDYSKTYGDVNPAFVVNVTGFVNGETTASAIGFTAPVVTCTAAAFTGVGSYPITISGGYAANYTFDTTDTGALTISEKTLTATASAIGKVYNRNTDAAGNIGLTGIVNSDAVTAGAIFTFEDAVAGTGKTVNVSNITLGGEKKDNYTLSNTTASAIADITPKTLGVTVSAISKPYDGTTSATGAVTLSGIIAPDVVTAGAVFTFADAAVGTNKTVNVTSIGPGGADAGNYAISSTTASAIADITKLAQTAITYNNATTTYGAVSFSHAATGGSGTGAFSYSSGNTSVAAINASTGEVTIAGAGTTTLTAIKAGDATYGAASKSCTITVSKAPLTATVGDYSKTYGDANPTFAVNVSGFVNGETAATAAGYAAPSAICAATAATGVGTSQITISGGSAANYSFNTTDTGTLTINAKTVNATASAISRQYDGTTNATGTVTLSGIIAPDAVTASASFAFGSKTAGTNKTVNVANIMLGGADAGNYAVDITTAAIKAGITPKTLGVTVSAISKPYDSKTSATGVVTLSGIIAPDTVTASAIFTFADASVGTDKTVNVSNIELGGGDSGNYTISTTTAAVKANITKQVQSISVTSMPGKMTYQYGEKLDPLGGILTITYTDTATPRESTILTSDMCDVTTTPTIGVRTVTVTYLGKTATFDVTYTKAVQVAPAAPELLITQDGIVVTTPAGAAFEYSCDSGATWQASAKFAGLTYAASYTILARLKETTTHHASPASPGTAVTFTGSSVPAITAGTVTRISDTSGIVKFMSNISGQYYFKIAEDGEDVPLISTTEAGAACKVGENSITDPAGLTAGAKDIYIKAKDTAGNISNTLKIDIPAYSAPKLTPGTVTRTSDTGGAVKFLSDKGGQYYYIVAPDGQTEPFLSTSGAGTEFKAGETTIANPVGLTAGAKYIYIKAKGEDGYISNTLKIYIPAYSAPQTDNGGNADTSPTPTPAPTPTPTPIPAQTSKPTEVIINGQTYNYGTTETTTKTSPQGENTITTTVTVDDKKVEERLNAGGNGSTVIIPVKDAADVVVGQLNGQTVKNMEAREAVLEIRTENVTYTLPAAQINIDTVSSQIGSQVQLKDIKVNVTIAVPPANTVRTVQDSASKNGYQIVVKPVDFEITCTSGNKTVEVSEFNGYVERTIAIPDGIDPSRITTGIVLNTDGTFSHVPTTITVINGKYFAKINSLTNSTYSVIWSPKIFKDMEKHWAKEDVTDMGSRLIVNGIDNENFVPEKAITRGEFASIIIKGLGLMRTGTGKDTFKDARKTDWYYDAVYLAKEYGLIKGIGDSKFEPNRAIKREEAMAIIARAMALTKLDCKVNNGDTLKLLDGYKDKNGISSWAVQAATACIRNKIFKGSGNMIKANKNITRAEAAVIVRRLLKKSNLI